MINLLHKLQSTEVSSDQIAVCSLGQAGYIYKISSEIYVTIDPYLTNYCEHRIGLSFKRHFPSLLDPKELEALPLSAYLLTHHHEDHLDVECIESLSSNHFKFYAPPTSITILNDLGVRKERCHPLYDGSYYEQDKFNVYGVYADHGELAPDAVGIIVKSNGKTIYHMGDTALREEQLKRISNDVSIDLLILPINGKYGNMNEHDAAVALSILQPRYVTPCHYWALPGNSGGDPLLFMEAAHTSSPSSEIHLFTQGEIFIV
jgi:L-ascorbate 6-phosphate lactonase